MSSVFEFFDGYVVDHHAELDWSEAPDHVDVKLRLDFPGPLTVDAARDVFLSLQTRCVLFAHLAIPEIYEEFRQRGVGELFIPLLADYGPDYFVAEIARLTAGSPLEVDIRIRISTKGKKAGKNQPDRFLRCLLASFVTFITIWSGTLTILDHMNQPLQFPPPTTDVIANVEQFAPMPTSTPSIVKLRVACENDNALCTVDLRPESTQTA